jgi:hypothetical protein
VSDLRVTALHVEQTIRSAIKIHLLHLVGILFPHILVVFNEISLLTGFYWLELYKYKIRLNLETGMENENS